MTVSSVDEAHLEVELGELRLAIAAQVLVAEAAGDLEVAVEAGDHEELLELLGALRQGVDRARLEARRDDEVAGALGGALDQDRRLDLDEPVRLVDVAGSRRRARSEAASWPASARAGCRGSGTAGGRPRRPAASGSLM